MSTFDESMDDIELPELQFARVLLEYQLSDDKNNIDLIAKLKSCCAYQAIRLGENAEDKSNSSIVEEFKDWELETKFWDLAELLYYNRYRSPAQGTMETLPLLSDSTNERNFLDKKAKLRDLLSIIYWIQNNSVNLDNINELKNLSSGKWQHTRMSIQNRDLKTLSGQNERDNDLVDKIDSDAMIRTEKSIDLTDRDVDNSNFYVIYKLILANKIDEAIEFADSTGNFTMSLILAGSVQDYADPENDKRKDSFLPFSDFIEESTESRIFKSSIAFEPGDIEDTKRKLLFQHTVYKLSQQPKLDKYEALIYNYLSGGSISPNLEDASENWEESLLLYLNQMYKYTREQELLKIVAAFSEEGTLNATLPPPSAKTIDEVLNLLVHSDKKLADIASHPLRIIAGSIMINKQNSLLHEAAESYSSGAGTDDNGNLLQTDLVCRVLAHLSIVYSLQDVHAFTSKDITNIIAAYISNLKQKGLTDIIPLYLSFIPDESDSRECYSIFLSSITDNEERAKQIQIAKQYKILFSSYDDVNKSNENKIHLVLRRTVERVMRETEFAYTPDKKVKVPSETSEIEEVDYKLYRSVEWFFEYSMYEDAILASLVVVRRFLLCGKLLALKSFGLGKNFKQLIKNYDIESQTKSMGAISSEILSEESKEELLNYEAFIQAIFLLGDWKKFLDDNKINCTSSSRKSNFWKSSYLANSIEKVTTVLNNIVKDWFTYLSHTGVESELLGELRSIYIPYLIIELQKIYQYASLSDWKYIRKGFGLINKVADEENDYLNCFLKSERLNEFLRSCGEMSMFAAEKGIDGIYIHR